MRQRPVRLEIVTENRPSGNGLLPSFNVQEMAIFTLRTLEANGPERPAPMIRDESRRTGDLLKEELPILRAVDVVKAAHRPILQPRNSQILDELGSNTKRGQAIDVKICRKHTQHTPRQRLDRKTRHMRTK